MGLLSPLLLALGVAAAVPLLLHLLQRHQGPRVVFPALRYLRRAEKESARRIRVRQILLMLLRVAAILLIALAAARPFVRATGAGHSPTAVALILDNSMSSAVVDGERRVLDELKARALEALAAAGPEDRFWLLRAGTPAEPALAGDAGQTSQRVRETEPSAAVADIPAALRRATALLAAGAEGRAPEIHLLTDLQAASFPAPAAADSAAPPIIVWHPGRAAPPNRSVAVVEVGGGMAPIAGERTTVAAAVAGDGDDAVSVRLTVGDALVAAAMARPGTAAVLSMTGQPAGILTGHVEIDADGLRMDDRRYFAARVLPPPAVAVRGVLPFVEDALEVLVNAGRVRVVGDAAADVTIHAAAEGLALAPTRTAVVLPPAAAVELPATNGRLAAAGIPWRFEAPLPGEARLAAADDDPLLRAFDAVRLRQVYPLIREDAAQADTVLLRLSDGAPWAVRGERPTGGRYVILATPLNAEASTLPTSAAMLPLLDRLTGAWAAAQPPRTDARAGEEVRVPAAATVVTRPDGARDAVVPDGTYQLGEEPGIYRFLSGDSVVAAFTVNPAAEASDLSRLDRRGLEARLPGWTTYITTDAGAWQRATFRERLGREFWRPLLAALLFVLILETIIAAAGRSRAVAATTRAAADPEPG
jgi:hypothetical protein